LDPAIRAGIFNAVRNEPFAKALRMKLVALDVGYSRVEMIYHPELMDNIYDRAHGGALFAMIDEAFETASQTHGTIAVALNVNVTYIRPPERNETLTAEAREVSRTRKTAGYEIRVTNAEDDLVATCQALAYRTGKPVVFSDARQEDQL